MIEQEKQSRNEILKELDINEETLTQYESTLELNTDPSNGSLEYFTKEDFDTLKLFHKLSKSGLSESELKILSTFSEVLKKVDIENTGEIRTLLTISPVYRLKQSLSITKQEFCNLKEKVCELEEALNKEIEGRAEANKKIITLQAEIEAKQSTAENLENRLSEILVQKGQLESQLTMSKDSRSSIQSSSQLKGKKAKQLQEDLTQKDIEIEEIKKKNTELELKLKQKEEEASELNERLELLEDEISEMEEEIEERYQEQVSTLKEKIESLIEQKQKEWDSYHLQLNEQHKNDLVNLQKKYEEEISLLKQAIIEQEKSESTQGNKNSLLGMFKK